jgi:ABC-type branched-subunit amino acid transport system substrate-binding protein
MRRLWKLEVLAVIVPAVVVAGCSSSKSTGGNTAGSSSASTSASTSASASSGGNSGPTAKGSVHFGVLRPFTGQYASVGQAAREGALTATKAINDAGGILNQKLTMDSADTLGDPADAVPALQKLLATNHVVGIVGPGGAEIGAVQPILDRDKIPFMFGGGSSSFDHNADPWFWRVTPSDSQLAVAMAAYAYDKGYRTAAMMFSTIDTAQTLTDPVQATFEKLGGKIVANVKLSPGQSSYSSEVLTVKNASPDVVFTQMEPATGAVVMNAFAELGKSFPMVGSDILAGSDFIKAVTPAVAQKYVTALVGATTGGAGDPTFQQDYKQLYNHQPLAGANYAYDATIVLALAAQIAGSTDSTKIEAAIPKTSDPSGVKVSDYASALAALKQGKAINYEGASGSMDFNSYHNVFGPFDAVQSDGSASDNLKTVATITPDELAKAAP